MASSSGTGGPRPARPWAAGSRSRRVGPRMSRSAGSLGSTPRPPGQRPESSPALAPGARSPPPLLNPEEATRAAASALAGASPGTPTARASRGSAARC